MSDTTTPVASHTITLDFPIKRGATEIKEITVNRPKALQLMGLSMRDLMGTQVSAYLELLPRVTLPPLIEQEIQELEAPDVAEIVGVMRDFFMTKAEQAMFQTLIEDRLSKA
ncbi:hypothetical protein FHW96_002352 [Novosphingobium sp. SG751A]|uniref:phage tail assembly protein n=1 Tax=Novosphingobium sp. SG751A TaxID=2587000 RepID=UPI0015551D00|nr:phage tail assembly protein [Novosphingobium sp. SG751A]NOW46194.1 hypothetical protein [Novosphingobium sp. SG751A]